MYSKLLAGERIGKTLFTIPDTNLTCMKGKLRTALDSTQEAVYLTWTPHPPAHNAVQQQYQPQYKPLCRLKGNPLKEIQLGNELKMKMLTVISNSDPFCFIYSCLFF